MGDGMKSEQKIKQLRNFLSGVCVVKMVRGSVTRDAPSSEPTVYKTPNRDYPATYKTLPTDHELPNRKLPTANLKNREPRTANCEP
jgi:hypothetical protein